MTAAFFTSMSDNNWRHRNALIVLGLAFASLVAVAALTAQSNEKESSGSQKQQESLNAPDQPRTSAVGAIVEADSPSDLNKACAPGQENRNSDLCAQWKAADAAEKSAFWTQWTALLGIGGLGLGAGTMFAAIFAALYARQAAIHTEAGAREAKRSADAAFDAIGQSKTDAAAALAHARDVFNADYRPFVLFTYGPNAEFDSSALFASGETVDLCIRNFGRAPSNRIYWAFYHKIVDIPKNGGNYQRLDCGLFHYLTHILAPGQDYVFCVQIDLSAEEIKYIKSGKIYFCQVVILHDGQSEFERIDEAFFAIESDVDGGLHLARISNGNVWTHEEWRNEEAVRRQNEKFEAERRARDKAVADAKDAKS